MPAYFAMLFDDDFLEISNMTECLEGGEDGDDLIGALFVLLPKQVARDSGAWPTVDRSLRTAATWAGR